MVIKLLRLIFGYVEFKAEGGFPERFLNLCNINGITLWNVKNNGVKVEACTPVKAYRNIRKPARKSGMKVRISRKRGLPFFVKHNKARAGVLVGIFFSILLLFLSSCVLWDVEVTGNVNIKSEELLNSLSAYNVKIGAVKSRIDTKSVGAQLLKEYPGLSWASVNIFGMKAVLEVKENTDKPEITDDDIPMNIVAKKDGRIVLVNGYSGTNAVKENDVVLKGDLLISGTATKQDGSEKLVRAKGKVFAETVTLLSAEVYRAKEVQISEKTEIRYKIYLLGAELPVGFGCKGDELYNSKRLLEGKSSTLPLGITWTVFYESDYESIELSDSNVKLLSLLSVVEKKRSEFTEESEILREEYSEKMTENGFLTENKIVAKENIAVEKELYVE